MDESKRALRVAALSQRNSLSSTQQASWSRLIQARVLESPFYCRAEAVALYSSVQNEVNTDGIRDHALECGKKVFYPRLTPQRSLLFVQIQSAAELVPGKLGILEPTGDKLLAEFTDVDLLVLVPGVAFDLKGNRLGRGQGWYDRLLRSMRDQATFVGLGYEFQIVENVPVQSWDETVRYIITEHRIIDCSTTQEQPMLC